MNDNNPPTSSTTALKSVDDVPMSSAERHTLSFIDAKIRDLHHLAVRTGVPYREDLSAAETFLKKWRSRAVDVPQQTKTKQTKPQRIPVHTRSENSRARRTIHAQGDHELYAEEDQDPTGSYVVGENGDVPGSPANHDPQVYTVPRLPFTAGDENGVLEPSRQGGPRGILTEYDALRNNQGNISAAGTSEADPGFRIPAFHISDERRLKRVRMRFGLDEAGGAWMCDHCGRRLDSTCANPDWHCCWPIWGTRSH